MLKKSVARPAPQKLWAPLDEGVYHKSCFMSQL